MMTVMVTIMVMMMMMVQESSGSVGLHVPGDVDLPDDDSDDNNDGDDGDDDGAGIVRLSGPTCAW